MKKLLTVLGVALVVGASPNGALAQANVVKFACYIPLTGPVAQFGKNMQNGFRQAVEDFARSGRLKGAKVAIECQDDQNRADDAINLARKFIEDESYVAAIGSWGSTVTLAAGPIYNKAGMVNITPISSHPAVTKIGRYVFRQSIIQSKEGPANAAYLRKLGVTRLSMIGLPNDYGKANMFLTRRAFEALGGKVVFSEFIRPDTQDYRQILQKAARAKPDTIYLGVFAFHAALIAKQARQLGIRIPVFGSAALGTYDFTRLAGDAANGVRMILVFNPAVGPGMAAFFAKFEKRFGYRPGPFATNAYITATMMFDIVAGQYPKVTRESIRTALDGQTRLDTIAGPMSYDRKTREWSFRLRQGLIDKGDFKLVD